MSSPLLCSLIWGNCLLDSYWWHYWQSLFKILLGFWELSNSVVFLLFLILFIFIKNSVEFIEHRMYKLVTVQFVRKWWMCYFDLDTYCLLYTSFMYVISIWIVGIHCAGTANLSGATEFTSTFQWGSCCSIFSFLCCAL